MKREYTTAGNPYLPLWEHLPDGEPRVFEDPDNPGRFRLYIIGSHDVRNDSYCGPDIRAWSAPVDNLHNWRDEGSIFTYEINGYHDVMYAPDLVELVRKDGTKEYYLYPHSRGPQREAMVCKGPSPVGPFTPINLVPDGTRTVEGSIMGFDPAVYIEYVTDPADPDFATGFRAYGFWGFQRIHAAELDPATMYSLRPGKEIINCFIPSSSRYGEIRDPAGTTYPHVYDGEDLNTFNFFEAASIRKIGNKYVWVYSGYSGPDYGLPSTNSALRYAFGDTPLGPWRSGGVLVDSRAVGVNQDGTALETGYPGHNTHGSLEFVNGQWYCFYHRAPRGSGWARQPMVAPVDISWDETPVAQGGTLTVRAQGYTAAAGGHEYKGAEVTSEGFAIQGLEPYRYYSAGLACYLSEPRVQADAWDIWHDHAPLVDVADGHITGYKYFNMDNIKEDTYFQVFINPKTPHAFKLHVWLGSPWENAPHHGQHLGSLDIPAGSTSTQLSLDVGEKLAGLTGKHALYLVAEAERMGPHVRRGPLCDVLGLGFACSGRALAVPPVVPAVSIIVNDMVLPLCPTPIRSTHQNGVAGYDQYEEHITLAPGCTRIPTVQATASQADVKVTVVPPTALPGVATVQFDWRGAVKTYTLHFS